MNISKTSLVLIFSAVLFVSALIFSALMDNHNLSAYAYNIASNDVEDNGIKNSEMIISADREKDNIEGTPPGMVNPAAVYCGELGYGYSIDNEPRGQVGYCIFPDGSRCDEWLFFEGKCGQGWSYCAINDYDIIVKTDRKDPFSKEYAVCVDKEGREIGSVTELMGLAEKSLGCNTQPDKESGEIIELQKENGEKQKIPESVGYKK